MRPVARAAVRFKSGRPDIPVTPPALSFRLTGVPSRMTLRTIRTKGVPVTVEPNQATSFFIELLGTAKAIRLANVGDVVRLTIR